MRRRRDAGKNGVRNVAWNPRMGFNFAFDASGSQKLNRKDREERPLRARRRLELCGGSIQNYSPRRTRSYTKESQDPTQAKTGLECSEARLSVLLARSLPPPEKRLRSG